MPHPFIIPEQEMYGESGRVNGAGGTAAWDGAGAPVAELLSGSASLPPVSHEEEIAGALAEFVSALRSGEVPSGVHSNVLSLAMVEAAVNSASTGQRVLIDDVVEDAYRIALASERRTDARAALEGWGSARGRVGEGTGARVS